MSVSRSYNNNFQPQIPGNKKVKHVPKHLPCITVHHYCLFTCDIHQVHVHDWIAVHLNKRCIAQLWYKLNDQIIKKIVQLKTFQRKICFLKKVTSNNLYTKLQIFSCICSVQWLGNDNSIFLLLLLCTWYTCHKHLRQNICLRNTVSVLYILSIYMYLFTCFECNSSLLQNQLLWTNN